MKRSLLLTVLITTLLFCSCGRDEDKGPVTPQTQENSIKKLILGKWRLQFTATDWNRNGVPDQDEKEFPDEIAFITFNIDGTVIVTDEQGTPSNESFTQWTLNDKELKLTSPEDSFHNEDEPYTIVTLNTLEMLWKTPEDSANFFYIGFTRE